MRDIAEFDILVLAGLYNSGPEHWQSHWEAAFPNMRRVQQDDWDTPLYADWALRLSEAVDRCTKPVLLIAHSLGTLLIMRWAHAAKTEAVAGAFLVAPTDRDRRDNDPARGFSPMLLQPLPFPSMVLASRNDELVAFERARVFAMSWGSHLIDVGSLGCQPRPLAARARLVRPVHRFPASALARQTRDQPCSINRLISGRPHARA